MGKFALPERVSTKSFVVLIIENSKSNHLGAQGTFNQRSPCAQGMFGAAATLAQRHLDTAGGDGEAAYLLGATFLASGVYSIYYNNYTHIVVCWRRLG